MAGVPGHLANALAESLGSILAAIDDAKSQSVSIESLLTHADTGNGERALKNFGDYRKEGGSDD